jgi:hypothetical protein
VTHPADGYPARRPASSRDIWTFLSSLGESECFSSLLRAPSLFNTSPAHDRLHRALRGDQEEPNPPRSLAHSGAQPTDVIAVATVPARASPPLYNPAAYSSRQFRRGRPPEPALPRALGRPGPHPGPHAPRFSFDSRVRYAPYSTSRVDGAGWHKGDDVDAFLQTHPRLHLDYLPRYQPALNPQERVWRRMRYEPTTNRWFPELNAIWSTVCMTHRSWSPQKLKRLRHNG